MRVQHNIVAMNSYRNFNVNNTKLGKDLEKLSSGYRINRAGDDAAGLAISEKMRAQITGLEVAQKNAKDGISLVQTAEGALTEVHDMLNRMYSLAEQSANGTYSNDTDREQLQKEIVSLRDEINRIADSSNFNGTALLNGDLNAGKIYEKSQTNDTNMKLSGFEWETAQGYKTKYGSLVSAALEQAGSNLTVKVSVTGSSVDSSGVASGTVKFSAVSYTVDDVDGKKVTISIAAATVTMSDGTAEVAVKVKISSGDTQLQDSAEFGKFKITFGADILNGKSEFLMGAGKALQLQIGDTSKDFNQMKVNVGDIHVAALGLEKIDVSDQENAATALDKIKTAINTVSDIRGGLGALQNRLDHTINNLGVMAENIQNAESTIRDTDVAEQMMKYTKNSILNQSAQAMLAQSNQLPQGVLQLLQ